MILYLPQAWQFDLGFSWQLCIGTLVSLLVCVSVKKPEISPEKISVKNSEILKNEKYQTQVNLHGE